MAVHWRGLMEGQAQKAQRSLGRVRVTIDNLEALRDLLDASQSTGAAATVLEFEGGWFDHPSDMPKLSDHALRRITVKSSEVEVVLSPTSAIAIGDPNVCDAVYTRWARQNPTRERPIPLGKFQLFPGGLLAFATIVIAMSGFLLPTDPGAEISVPKPLYLAIIAAFGVGAASIMTFKLPRSYAVVHALTNEEYRKQRAESNRHWRVIAMMAIAACIALGTWLTTTLLM